MFPTEQTKEITAISYYFVMDWAAVWLDIAGGLLIATRACPLPHRHVHLRVAFHATGNASACAFASLTRSWLTSQQVI